MPRTTRHLRFEGAAGHDLAARLELPEGVDEGTEPATFAIFAHCFTCTKDLKAIVRISRGLAERGIAVLRFDFTGLGESGGEFTNTDFTSNLADLMAAAEFLRSRYAAPRLLLGHSLGGAAVLAAARHMPEVRGVVTIAAPSETGHLSRVLTERAPELVDGESADVSIGGTSYRIRRKLLDDLAEHDLAEHIQDLGRPLLVLHSPDDEIVDIGQAERIFDAARQPKSFVALAGADHLLLRRPEDSVFVAELVAAWSDRYIGSPGAGDRIIRSVEEVS